MDIVHQSDVDPSERDRGEYAFERRQLGAAVGAEKLGCSLHEVPPGKRTYPYHYHTANEEAIYVLDGEGELRGPDDERVALEPGIYATFPTGPEGVHQVENTGDEPLRFLAISTMIEPDVVVYPDSEKVGVIAGSPPGDEGDERILTAFFRQDDEVGYWDGES